MTGIIYLNYNRQDGDVSREFVQLGMEHLAGGIELHRADYRIQVHQDNAADIPSQNELKQALEKGNDEQKIETMVRLHNCCCPALHDVAV